MYKYKNTLEKTVSDAAFKSTNLLYARVFDIIHFSACFKERRNYTFHSRKNEKYTAEIARNLPSQVSLQTKPISIVDLRNHYEMNLKEPRSRLSWDHW